MNTMNARLLWLVPLALASCSYVSDYVPPADGRARVVWRDGDPTALIPRESGTCRAAAEQAASAPSSPQRCAEHGGCGEVYWVTHAPIYEIDGPIVPIRDFGPGAVHGPTVGHPPHPPAPGGGTHQAMPVGSPKASAGHAKPLPSLGSSGGGDKGIGELLIVAVVVAIVTLPIVAITMAASTVENEPKSAGAIDLVNAYNDVARSAPNACLPASYPPPPASTGTEVQP